MDAETKAGLLAGLEIRTPRLNRSGFFVSAEGAVLTTTEAVEGCTRVTIDHATEATVALTDAKTGLALLTPNVPLAPRSFASFPASAGRPGSEITLSGYSYEDRLPAPVLTFGTLEELTGLDGEADLRRLAIASLPGDVGGPVLDATGGLIGMLLPAAVPAGKQLPPGVVFALGASAIANAIEPAGVVPSPTEASAALAPSDLADLATGMTALVSCWD
ncbi:MAG: trypsin-like peptidase domain-containing protein [Tabrizicola sp.]|nr:trypsin-like peptidase domain-containing protein [Tabrizicola sp.]